MEVRIRLGVLVYLIESCSLILLLILNLSFVVVKYFIDLLDNEL